MDEAVKAPEAKRQRTDEEDVDRHRFLQADGTRRFASLDPQEHAGPEKPFFFMQMADTQLGMEAMFNGGDETFGWSKEIALMRRAVDEVNRLRPAFAILCGDLIDEWPQNEVDRVGARAELLEKQIRDFKQEMRRVDRDIPLVCLCGNHDVGDRPNSITMAAYRKEFGDDYFSFWCNGVKCIVVNSQFWKDDRDAKSLREDMDRWLDDELSDKKGDVEQDGENPTKPDASKSPRILMFSHVPPFVFDPDEPNEYFNLDRGLRKQLLSKMARKNCKAWFCGHYHRNAGGMYRDTDNVHELEVVVTSAVGTQIVDKTGGDPLGKSGIAGCKIGEDLSGLRLVKVLPGRIEHEWKSFTELSKIPCVDVSPPPSAAL